MKATNKQEFFELLGYELGRLGIDDTADIFADFEEHFEDGAMQGIPEEQTAERLGDIKEIARSYLNLESSRINSIVARDNERKHGVSLTKPGRDVPADLSLLHKNAVNSDNIREYTPEHFSEEIYPNSNRIAPSFNANSQSANSQGTNTQNANPQGTGSGEKTVAGAFSEAGRAALDAAKVTGSAIKDAFGQSGVKNAVVGAGKSAADAVKTAGKAVKNAKAKHDAQKAQDAPKPSESYRANHSSSRQGSIPPQYGKPNVKKGYKVINVSDMKPNVDGGLLAVAILLDVFVWSWVIPTVFSIAVGMTFVASGGFITAGFRAFFGINYIQFWGISRIFLATGFWSLAVVMICLGIIFIKLCVNLVKFVINLHIKAIYSL